MIKLIRPCLEYQNGYTDYIAEWENTGEKIVPYAASRNGMDYNSLLLKWEKETTDEIRERGFVPASLFFLADEDKRILGALHIRHELNERLFKTGGHIGYGIRPSERKKGYAAKMLSLALPIAKELGIDKALICCDKHNIGSSRTIQKNGGVLENEVCQNDEIVQRYWIDLS